MEREFISPAEAMERARLSFFSARRVPNPFARDRLYESGLPPEDALLRTLMSKFSPDSGWAQEFARFNKLVVNPLSGDTVVVPRVGGVLDEDYPEKAAAAVDKHEEKLAKGFEEVATAELEKRKLRSAVRKRLRAGRAGKPSYTLGHFVGDTNVYQKFGFSYTDVQNFTRMAVVDPVRAANLIESLLKRMGHDCVVKVGEYKQGRRASRERLRSAVAATSHANTSIDFTVYSDTVCVVGPTDDEGRSKWTIVGPVDATSEVVATARMVLIHGTVSVNALFAVDLALLAIRVVEEDVFVPHGIETHLGHDGIEQGISGTSGEMYSEAVRSAAARVLPVMHNGRVVATSVVTSRDTALVNWHVADVDSETNMTLGEDGTEFLLSHDTGFDLWAVRMQAEHQFKSAWLLREAQVGERVVVVYCVGNGRVEYSDLVDVVKSESGSVVTQRFAQARGGLSGAALVALTDGALLGVYHGAVLNQCVFTCVASDVVQVHAVNSVSPTADSSGDAFWHEMQRRSLSSVFMAAVQSLAPLMEGEVQIGCAARYGNSMYTTLDSSVWQYTYGASDVSPVFVSAHPDHYVAATVPMGLTGALSYVRTAQPGEQVHLVGLDHRSAFISESLMVERVASDSRRLWLTAPKTVATPYAGCLVVAASDAAVLGQYVSNELTGKGVMAKCVGFLPRTAAVSEPVRLMAAVSQAVHPVLWPQSVLSDYSMVESATVRLYADVGRSAVQSTAAVAAVRDGRLDIGALPTPGADDAVWAARAYVNSDVHKLLSVAQGKIQGPLQQAEYVLAFFGLVAVYEGMDVAAVVMRQFGWLDTGTSKRSSAFVETPTTPIVKPIGFGGMF